MKIFLARRSEPLPADTEECISEFADPVSALVGDPIVWRTWAVWLASSRRQDVAQLIAALGRHRVVVTPMLRCS